MTDISVAPTLKADFQSDETTERFIMMWGLWATLKLCADPSVKTVLDIGCGAGEHTRLLRHFGKEVFTNDWKTDCDYPGDILDIEFDRQYDAVLCSHVIEHQRNVGLFLEKMFTLVKDGGVFSLAVPIHQQRGLVLGHLSVWSSHLLAYNLVQAGQDCSSAQCLEDNECTIYTPKMLFDRASVKEIRWMERFGKAYSAATTAPWHDTIEILATFMPAGTMTPDWKEKRAYNWDSNILLPVPPHSTKNIEILTRKQDEPICLRYDAIVAKAAAA